MRQADAAVQKLSGLRDDGVVTPVDTAQGLAAVPVGTLALQGALRVGLSAILFLLVLSLALLLLRSMLRGLEPDVEGGAPDGRFPNAYRYSEILRCYMGVGFLLVFTCIVIRVALW